MRCILYGVLLLAACSRDITAPTPALLVTASVSRTAFRVGDTVSVLVSVFNRSAQPQTIGGSGCGLLGFEITTPDGTVVGPNPIPCIAILILKTLAPGEQYSETQSWNGSAIETVTDPPPRSLTPGTYFVVGAVYPYSPGGLSKANLAIDHVPAVIAISR